MATTLNQADLALGWTSADFTYTPARDFFGADSFTFTVEGGNGGFDNATIAIEVTEAPLIATKLSASPALLQASTSDLNIWLISAEARLVAEDRTPLADQEVIFRAVCVKLFGEPRQSGTSHAVFKTPWPGDPRVNIQKSSGGKPRPTKSDKYSRPSTS